MSERALALRETFDLSFAQSSSAAAAATESLLEIRVGAARYLLRLADVSGVFVDKKITWLPSPVSELLGIAGFRGAVLPVYDLGMLLGCSTAAAPRWLVVTAAAPVGLAFEGFGGYLSVRSDAVVQVGRVEAVERHVREVVQGEGAMPIIHVPSILETIRNHAGHNKQT